MDAPEQEFIHSASTKITAFDIGHDFAFYRMPVPDTSCQEVLDGFAQKKMQGGSSRRSTLSIRKWLNLRLHAYERKIHIDDDVTADFIDELYQKTGGNCPATRALMTQGTLTETDWSVDRVLNEFGYVRPNIAVMSTLANKAKGNLTLDEIKAIRDTKTPFKGLEYIHWANLYSLVFEVNDKLTIVRELGDIKTDAFKTTVFINIVDIITDPFQSDESEYFQTISMIMYHTPKSQLKSLRRKFCSISKRRNTNEPLPDLMDRSRRLRKEVQILSTLFDWNTIIDDIDESRKAYVNAHDRVRAATRLK